MAAEICLSLLQSMRYGTVIALIDHVPTVVTDLQADIHGLPVVYTYEESRLVTKVAAKWRKHEYLKDVAHELGVINKRIARLEQRAEHTMWTNGNKWEQQCQKWEREHRQAMERVQGVSDAMRFV